MKTTAIRWRACFLTFVLLWFFTLSLRQLLDYDVWFQLLAGQETFRTMTVPKAEFYIYSALGEPAIFVGWLWGLILYMTWLLGGYPLMSVFSALVWALTFAIAVAAILRKVAFEVLNGEAHSPVVRIAAALIASAVAYEYLVSRAIFRAEVTFFLAWVVVIYLSAGVAVDQGRQRRFLIAVPLLSWVLGWLHTTSVFMLLALAGYMLQSAAAVVSQRGFAGLAEFARGCSWQWLASIGAAVLLPCLNPNGFAQALPLIVSLSEVLQQSGTSTHVNFEYRKLADVPTLWPTAFLFAVASAISVWQDKSQRVVNVIFLSTGMLLSLLHIRALAIWAIFLIVPLGVAMSCLLQKLTKDSEARSVNALLGALGIACCLWTAGTLFIKEYPRWGFGYVPRPADEKLLGEIRANMPQGGNVFNWFPLGGYLRWHLGPGFFVAMDGHLTNTTSAAWKAYRDIEDVRDQRLSELEKWNINAVYHPVLTPPLGRLHWLPHDLVHSGKWRLVAGDQIGLLYVRADQSSSHEAAGNNWKAAYWRRVIHDVTYNASTFGSRDTIEEKAKIIKYAQQRIAEIEASGK